MPRIRTTLRGVRAFLDRLLLSRPPASARGRTRIAGAGPRPPRLLGRRRPSRPRTFRSRRVNARPGRDLTGRLMRTRLTPTHRTDVARPPPGRDRPFPGRQRVSPARRVLDLRRGTTVAVRPRRNGRNQPRVARRGLPSVPRRQDSRPSLVGRPRSRSAGRRDVGRVRVSGRRRLAAIRNNRADVGGRSLVRIRRSRLPIRRRRNNGPDIGRRADNGGVPGGRDSPIARLPGSRRNHRRGRSRMSVERALRRGSRPPFARRGRGGDRPAQPGDRHRGRRRVVRHHRPGPAVLGQRDVRRPRTTPRTRPLTRPGEAATLSGGRHGPLAWTGEAATFPRRGHRSLAGCGERTAFCRRGHGPLAGCGEASAFCGGGHGPLARPGEASAFAGRGHRSLRHPGFGLGSRPGNALLPARCLRRPARLARLNRVARQTVPRLSHRSGMVGPRRLRCLRRLSEGGRIPRLTGLADVLRVA